MIDREKVLHRVIAEAAHQAGVGAAYQVMLDYEPLFAPGTCVGVRFLMLVDATRFMFELGKLVGSADGLSMDEYSFICELTQDSGTARDSGDIVVFFPSVSLATP